MGLTSAEGQKPECLKGTANNILKIIMISQNPMM
jgi:hypothetical protein